MRVLVVADIHANLAAFEAVIAAAKQDGDVDAIWCLGDIVGYGAEPGACLDLLRSYPHVAVAGNHDRAAAGQIGVGDFNPIAAQAVTWTSGQISGAEKNYLANLQTVAVEEEFTLVHGSLRDPVWEYLVSTNAAAAHFQKQTTPYSLIGHSHLQLAFFDEADSGAKETAVGNGSVLKLNATRLIANPGGLGQPRDGDPRTLYAIIDFETRSLVFHRIDYDIARAQSAIRRAGLPDFLAARLALGR